jgi:hypothetical protein
VHLQRVIRVRFSALAESLRRVRLSALAEPAELTVDLIFIYIFLYKITIDSYSTLGRTVILALDALLYEKGGYFSPFANSALKNTVIARLIVPV